MSVLWKTELIYLHTSYDGNSIFWLKEKKNLNSDLSATSK